MRVFTERLELRAPLESDRTRLIDLFGDPEFMAFSGGVLTPDAASVRFDQMAADAVLAFGKRPIVARDSETVVGYLPLIHIVRRVRVPVRRRTRRPTQVTKRTIAE